MSNNPNPEGFLGKILIYLSAMVFVLWMVGAIESFISVNWIWFSAAIQLLLVVKITVIFGVLLVPLFWFFKDQWIIRIGLLICLLIILSLALSISPYYNIP